MAMAEGGQETEAGGEPSLPAPSRMVPGQTAAGALRMRGKQTLSLSAKAEVAADESNADEATAGVAEVATSSGETQAADVQFRGTVSMRLGYPSEWTTAENPVANAASTGRINYSWIQWGILPGHQTAAVITLAAASAVVQPGVAFQRCLDRVCIQHRTPKLLRSNQLC